MNKQIEGYEGLYEVSEDGEIISVRHGAYRKLKQHAQVKDKGTPYLRVGLSKGGVSKTFLVHRLVCSAFHGKPEEGQEVRHLDGDSFHNHESNLAWGTRSENMMDAVQHGTHSSNREKTHCKNGHEFTPDNTMPRKGMPNGRMCRTCKRQWKNEWAARTRGGR